MGKEIRKYPWEFWRRYSIKKYLRIILGTFLMALAYKSIYDASELVTGGFSGIGIIVRKLAGVPLWLTNTILNIPVFLVAWKVKGREFVKITLFSTFWLTFFLGVIPSVLIEETDLLLAGVYGGVLCGTGIAQVIQAHAATGGTDMIASIIQKFLPYRSVGEIMQFLDGAVVLAGMVIFGIQKSLYAVIAIYVTTLVCDRLVDGLKFAKCLIIISERSEEIAWNVMRYLERGVTGLSGRGMYSGKKKNVLYCIVSRKESVVLKEIAARIDPEVFVIISDVREVMGEGFIAAENKAE